MSSTTNVQTYLTSVIRPVYTYTPATAVFTTQLDISNVNTVTANTVECLRADVSDSNSNVFVGTNSGVSFLGLRNSYDNTAVGYGAAGQISNTCNVVAVGINAAYGTSNTSNSVFIGNNMGGGSIGLKSVVWIDPLGGTQGGTTSSNTIAIGARTGVQGNSNIWIGSGAGYGNTGTNNITIGHAISNSLSSYSLLVGTGSNVVISADLSRNAVAIGKADASMLYTDGNGRVPGLVLDVSGYARIANGLAIGMDPLQSTLDVNGTFRADDGYGSLLLDHDLAGNSRATTSGFFQARGGVHSREGTSAGAGVSFGTACIGITLISVSTDALMVFWSGTGAAVTLSANPAGRIAVSTSGAITSTLANTVYTISYFPLPTVGLYTAGTGV